MGGGVKKETTLKISAFDKIYSLSTDVGQESQQVRALVTS